MPLHFIDSNLTLLSVTVYTIGVVKQSTWKIKRWLLCSKTGKSLFIFQFVTSSSNSIDQYSGYILIYTFLSFHEYYRSNILHEMDRSLPSYCAVSKHPCLSFTPSHVNCREDRLDYITIVLYLLTQVLAHSTTICSNNQSCIYTITTYQ